MNFNLLILGGYGQFVWPSFIFAFGICFYLYLKSKQELQKQEKLFLKEFKQLQSIRIVTNSQKKNSKKALSGNPVF